MLFLVILTTLLSLGYLVITIWLSQGLKRCNDTVSFKSHSEFLPTVSVVVAARNEENTIVRLLDSLNVQSYPADRFTVTVVNDRSTDATAEIVMDYRRIMKNLTVITVGTVPSGIAPKKNAIMNGIEATDGEIIVITDADCIVSEKWLEVVVANFQDKKIGLVQGLTGYDNKSENNILHRFQQVDFFSHSVVAAAGIGRNLPINSNANNFAYRRSIFESLSGYGDVAGVISGDDDLLLQKVWESGVWKIKYMSTPLASVKTDAPETFREMFEQRKRWGSKTVYYKPIQVAVLATIFLYYLLILLYSFISLVNWHYFPVLITLFAVKIIGELFFMIPGTAMFKRLELRRDIWWASPLQLFLVIFSVFSGVFGSFTWKGTTYERKIS